MRKHALHSDDPEGKIARALAAPIAEREPIVAPPKLPPIMPVPMGGLKPAPIRSGRRRDNEWPG